MADDLGRFPFGKGNTTRPIRHPRCRPARAVVVWVYPSAWHVAWTAPQHVRGGDRRGSVAALAVDVEPTVFWDGDRSDFLSRLTTWKTDVGFVDGEEPGCHGSVSTVSPSANGASGRKVADQYVSPLSIDPALVGFTDVYPVFVVKRTAVVPSAAQLGYDVSTLPGRPPASRLPVLAAQQFGDRLLADLEALDAPLVITPAERHSE